MGSNFPDAYVDDGEGPVRTIYLSPFAIAPVTVTNADFQRFVGSSGYVTSAEHAGWSFVFHLLLSSAAKRKATTVPEETPWWYRVEGACWQYPEGQGSSIELRLDHPVTHVSWHDALAYAHWNGTNLPTEAQWEFAARGGHDQKAFPWGDDLTPRGQHICNLWQGRFPGLNTVDDGFVGTAPARSFMPNDFGLFQMTGNVWEWCADSFVPDYHQMTATSDPFDARHSDLKSLRGGSFLCHKSYCHRYRNGARTGNTPHSTSSNTGFRVASATMSVSQP